MRRFAPLSGLIALLLTVFATCALAAPGTQRNLSHAVTGTRGAAKQWTVLVYLDADNNLEPYGIQDLNEMEQVGSSSDVNVLVQMDRSPNYDTTNGNWTTCRRYYVTADTDTATINSTLLADLGEVNMGSPDTLQSFITWGMANYPAQKYAVVFWDHGGGWRNRFAKVNRLGNKAAQAVRGDGSKALCWDDTNSSDCLYTKEWAGAIANATFPFAFVGFDVCLAGMIEPAYELWNTGKAAAMAASPPTEPGEGWPYATILADLVATPGMDGLTLADCVVTRYQQYYGIGQVAMSAFDLTRMPAALSAMNSFASAMVTRDCEWHTIKSIWETTVQYQDPYVDIRQFAENVRDQVSDATISNAAATAATALGNLVHTYFGNAPFDGRGLSISFPRTGPELAYTATNLQWVADSQWDEFLDTFGDVDFDAPGAAQLAEIANEDGNGSYELSWSPAYDNVGVAEYLVFELSGPASASFQDSAEAGSGSWTLSGFALSSAAAYQGTGSYYSGQGDNLDNTMTSTPVAIPAGSATTFSCWVNYDIETSFDYAFLKISSDGGATWSVKKSYTGSSGGWLNTQFDLTPYAGQLILIRLEYLTDSSVGCSGFYVDGISVTSRATSGTWTTDGLATTLPLTQRPAGTLTYVVYARDGAGNTGPASNTREVTVQLGDAPTIPLSVAVTPETPGQQDLTAEASGSTDANDDMVTYQYQWAKADGAGAWERWSYTGNVLPASKVSVGECWKVRARAYDGRNYSDWLTSSNVDLTSMVASASPGADGTGVPVNASLFVTFRWPMNEDSVQARFKLLNGTTEIAGKLHWDTANRKLRFKPRALLAADTLYKVRIEAGAICRDARVLNWSECFTFRTAAAASPAAVTVSALSTGAGAQVTVNLTGAASVRTLVTNIAGRVVAELPERALPQGLSTLLWDGRSHAGPRVPDGAYLIRVVARDGEGLQTSALTALHMQR
ncbi:MAG: clostripain-related cysteine peptidase [Armatimonadia bacterium]